MNWNFRTKKLILRTLREGYQSKEKPESCRAGTRHVHLESGEKTVVSLNVISFLGKLKQTEAKEQFNPHLQRILPIPNTEIQSLWLERRGRYHILIAYPYQSFLELLNPITPVKRSSELVHQLNPVFKFLHRIDIQAAEEGPPWREGLVKEKKKIPERQGTRCT